MILNKFLLGLAELLKALKYNRKLGLKNWQ